MSNRHIEENLNFLSISTGFLRRERLNWEFFGYFVNLMDITKIYPKMTKLYFFITDITMDILDISRISIAIISKKLIFLVNYLRNVKKISTDISGYFGYILEISFNISKNWLYPGIYPSRIYFLRIYLQNICKNILLGIYPKYLFLDISAGIFVFFQNIQQKHIFLKISEKKISFHIRYNKSYNWIYLRNIFDGYIQK